MYAELHMFITKNMGKLKANLFPVFLCIRQLHQCFIPLPLFTSMQVFQLRLRLNTNVRALAEACFQKSRPGKFLSKFKIILFEMLRSKRSRKKSKNDDRNKISPTEKSICKSKRLNRISIHIHICIYYTYTTSIEKYIEKTWFFIMKKGDFY